MSQYDEYVALIRRNLPERSFKSPVYDEEIPITYLDWTASSQPLDFIEKFISHKVLPFYANTHTLRVEKYHADISNYIGNIFCLSI